MSDTSSPSIRFGEFEIDLRAGELIHGLQRIRLQDQPLQILLLLLDRPGAVVTRDDLCKKLWPDGTIVEFDHSIATAIKKLRQALGDDAASPRYIETIPRRGFRYIGPPPTSNVPSETLPAAPAAQPELAAPPRRRKALWPIAALVAVLLAASFAALKLRTPKQPPPTPLFDQSTLTQVTTSTGLDIDPSLSPDGSSIAYSSEKSGSFEIYLKSLAPGGGEIQLTSDGDGNFQPAWSPDSKLIAFYSEKRHGIWLISSLGGAARRLTDFGGGPAWSPDGTRIAFQSRPRTDTAPTRYATLPPSAIWIVPVAGGAPVRLTEPGVPAGGHGAPAWSPDGKTIAFSSTSLAAGEVWVVASTGGQPHLVAANGAFQPVYAPHGGALYFTRAKPGSWALMRIALSLDGLPAGEPEMVQDTGPTLYQHIAFSADGRVMTYSAMSVANNLQSLPISPAGLPTGPPQPLTHDTSLRKTGPSFSSDGSKISYSVLQTGASPQVWVIDSDGKNARPIGARTSFTLCSGWLPGSSTLLFVDRRDDGDTVDTFDLDTGKIKSLRELAKEQGPVRISPDGRLLAFGSLRNGTTDIWTAPLRGGAPTQITFDHDFDGFPVWSSDSKFIAFDLKRQDGDHVAVVPAAGGPVSIIPTGAGANFASGWSPDDDKILFSSERDGRTNVFWVSLRDKTEKQLTHYTGRNIYVRYPVWSPRGNQIVYEYAETTGNIWVQQLH